MAIVHSKISELYPNVLKIVDMFAFSSVRKIAEQITKSNRLESARIIKGMKFLDIYVSDKCQQRLEFEYEFSDITADKANENQEFQNKIIAAIVYVVSRFVENSSVCVNLKTNNKLYELSYQVDNYENLAQIVYTIEKDRLSGETVSIEHIQKEFDSKKASCLISFEKNSKSTNNKFDLIFEFELNTTFKMHFLSPKSYFDSSLLEEIAKKTITIIKHLIK